jgi:hypothetical protein
VIEWRSGIGEQTLIWPHCEVVLGRGHRWKLTVEDWGIELLPQRKLTAPKRMILHFADKGLVPCHRPETIANQAVSWRLCC